jgi:hypothetical protein
VWVDFCSIAGTTPGTFTPATISPVSVTNGSYDGKNGRGFYIYGNPSTVTAALSNAVGQFNWCAYGSDFPPNAVDNTSGGYDLRGTPPFVITTAAGTAEVNAYTYSGGTITALTDATGCPGVLCGKDGESAGVLNCCVPGTTNCSGTCKTNGTYTTNDGTCAGTCNAAYVQLRNQCGVVINATYSTYTNTGCTTPTYLTNDGNCTGACNRRYQQERNACGVVVNAIKAVIADAACWNGCESTPADCTGKVLASTSNDAYVFADACRNVCTSAGYRYYQRWANTWTDAEGGTQRTFYCDCCN